MKKKKNFNVAEQSKLASDRGLKDKIARLAKGLIYPSEIDGEVTLFDGGRIGNARQKVTPKVLKFDPSKSIEERSFEEFFARLTTPREWFTDSQIKNAKRFARLKKLLEESLTDLHVYRVGRIQIDIYVVGIDADGNLIGIQTKAVET